MIKKLHYVWLGGKPLPAAVKECMESWRRHCPDWEIMRWDETNFDIGRYRWTREACERGKYAFAADFIRLWALKTFGGGYLDTDVQILRPIENVLDAPFVSGIENHGYGTDDLDGVTEDGFVKSTGQLYTRFCLQAGFMYAEPGHPFVDYCLEHFYGGGDRQFVNDDGSDNAFVIDLALMVALRKGWGMTYRDRTQQLPGGIKIYDSSVFATRKSRTDGSYLIHWFDQSWRTNGGLALKLKKLVKKHLYFLYRKL